MTAAEEESYRRGALAVTDEWLAVLVLLGASTLDSMEVVKEVQLKYVGHPYYQGQLALIQALRKMAEDDQRRFGSSPSAAPDEPPAAP